MVQTAMSLRRDRSCFKVGGGGGGGGHVLEVNLLSHEKNNFILTELNTSSPIQYILKSA